MAGNSGQDRDAQVDVLVAEVVRLRESGDEGKIADLLAQHPDLADSVEGFLRDQEFFARAAQVSQASIDTDANEARQTQVKPRDRTDRPPTVPAAGSSDVAKIAKRPAVTNREPTALAPVPVGPTSHARPAARAVGSPAGQVKPEPATTYVMALPADIAAGVRPFGRYRIEKLLGEGAMGAVYLAHDTQLDRKVALKTPKFNSDNAIRLGKRFRREAQSAATLHHRNICPVYDVGQIDGFDYLTMGYIEGKTLSAYVNPEKPLAQRQIALVIRKLALALQAAHDAGVVHRDLKPSNVIIDREGEPVVTDFGLAGRVDLSADSRLTKTGTILGTPAYMAPEQIEGVHKLIGPRSDIYSLGVVMYELLSGRLPFRGSPASVMGKVLVAKPPSLTDLRADMDPDLAKICDAMMVKHPAKRIALMKEVAERLTAWIRNSRQAEQTPPLSSSATDPAPVRNMVTTGEEMAALPKQAGSRWRANPHEISDARQTHEVKPVGPLLKTKAWFSSLPPRSRWLVAAAGTALPFLVLWGVTILIKITIDDDGNVTKEVTRLEDDDRVSAESDLAPGKPAAGSDPPATESEVVYGPWIDLFDGSGRSEWEHLGVFRIEGNELVANTKGAAKSKQIFEDFELEFEWKLEQGGNSGVYYRADPGVAVNVWPNIQSAEFALDATDSPPAETANGALWNVLAPTTIPQIDPEQFRNAKIVCNGTEVEHWIGGMLVLKYDTSAPSFQQVLANAKNQWFKDEGPLPSGRIYLQSNVGEVRFRKIRIREIRTGAGDWTSLDGNLAAWRLQQAKSETWKPLNQLWSSDGGTLKAKRDGQHWIETIKQYHDFEFECEYRLPNPLTVGANGSGVVLRAVGKNSGGFDPKGIEVDLRPNFDEEQGMGTGCFIGYETQLQNHRGFTQGYGSDSQSRNLGWLKQPSLRSNDWNELRLRCVGQVVEVTINGDLINRGWNLPHRMGSICLRSQNTEVEFRKVRVKELNTLGHDETSNAKIPLDAKAFAGHSYKVFEEVLSWKDAQRRCEAMGGHLATISNSAENRFVLNLVKAKFPKPDSQDAIWVGATDEVNVKRDARTTVHEVSPRWGFLRTSATDPGEPAVPIDLREIGILPGDRVRLKRLGYNSANVPGKPYDPEEKRFYRLCGLFSSSAEILSPDLLHRVPGAIDAGIDVKTSMWNFYSDRQANDIPEDFQIADWQSHDDETLVTVPVDARYLFVHGWIGGFHWRAFKNHGDLRVQISLVRPDDSRVALMTEDGSWKHYSANSSLSGFICEWDGLPIARTSNPAPPALVAGPDASSDTRRDHSGPYEGLTSGTWVSLMPELRSDLNQSSDRPGNEEMEVVLDSIADFSARHARTSFSHDAVVRARIRVKARGELNSNQGLSLGRYVAYVDRGAVGVGKNAGGWKDICRKVEATSFGDDLELSFARIKNRLIVFVNGTKVLDCTDQDFEGGTVGITSLRSTSAFSKVEFMDLSQGDSPNPTTRTSTLRRPQTQVLPIDVTRTYLKTAPNDSARPAIPIDLDALGYAPGDRIRLRKTGRFEQGENTDPRLYGLFSSSKTVLEHTRLHRVPDAIDARKPAWTCKIWETWGGGETNIPEDFAIADFDGKFESVEITIPPKAKYLFVTPWNGAVAIPLHRFSNLAVEISLVSLGNN